MKLSARNQIKGKIAKVTKGATTSHVQVDIGSGEIITASITNEAVSDLKLKKGDKARQLASGRQLRRATLSIFPDNNV